MTDTSRGPDKVLKPQARRPLRFTWQKLLMILLCLLGVTAFAVRDRAYCLYVRHNLSTLLNEIRLQEAVAAADRYGASVDCPQVRLLSVQAYRQNGDLQAAERLLADSESLISASDRVMQERTLIHVRMGQLSSGEALLPRLLRDTDLDSRDVCEAFAIGFRLNRRFEEAAVLLDAWKSDWPADFRPHYHDGLMRQTLTDWQTAVTSYRKAIGLNPNADQCRVRLGECLNQLGRHEEACEQFRIVTSRDSTNIDAWQGLAEGLQQQGQHVSARSAHVHVLALDPGIFAARLAIAEIDFDEGDIAAAERNIGELAAFWPDDARTLYLQSRIAASSGRHEESKKLHELWKVADLAVQQMEKEIQLLANSPDNIDLQVSIGTAMLNHYSRELGYQYIAAALQMAPNHSAAIAVLADFDARRKQLKMIPIPDSGIGQASDARHHGQRHE
ncbi:MAG: tetratricopeptide repeat protein [Fuerstiella sp.]|nr:tetratricopeptide repeat protein [Fuerstiella sp.]MCP4785095.1 tetratricopeptide repeat protein [Fuerstiella sp.]MCP4858780.1 tetratricopeptide repeat protein [Fuerstiella sp.]